MQAGFDMDDMDDAEEANEDDLVALEDPFAQVKMLAKHVQDSINDFCRANQEGAQYIAYCVK